MIRVAGIHAVVFVCIMLVRPALSAQQLVHSRNVYAPVNAVVPRSEFSAHVDPRLPVYAPTAQIMQAPALSNKVSARSRGILGYQRAESGDTKRALHQLATAIPAPFYHGRIAISLLARFRNVRAGAAYIVTDADDNSAYKISRWSPFCSVQLPPSPVVRPSVAAIARRFIGGRISPSIS